jgi:hypothetical protein
MSACAARGWSSGETYQSLAPPTQPPARAVQQAFSPSRPCANQDTSGTPFNALIANLLTLRYVLMTRARASSRPKAISTAREKRPLRRGWTTGTCATAAAKAAFAALVTGAFPDRSFCLTATAEWPAVHRLQASVRRNRSNRVRRAAAEPLRRGASGRLPPATTPAIVHSAPPRKRRR